MNTRHSYVRALIAAGCALVSLLAVAASAAVSPESGKAPARIIDAGTVVDSQLFRFN